MTVGNRFEFFELGVHHQQCNSLTILTKAVFFFYKTLSFHFFFCLGVLKPFLEIHSASSNPPHRHLTLKQTPKVIIQAGDKTVQQGTGHHHHKNDRVHIDNCHPAQVKYQHQTPPLALSCVLSCLLCTLYIHGCNSKQ